MTGLISLTLNKTLSRTFAFSNRKDFLHCVLDFQHFPPQPKIMNQPKLYLKHNSMQTRDNVYIIDKYLKWIQWKNYSGYMDKILDIGCGEGYTTLEVLLPKLPENFQKLIGCDISDSMVRFAKNKCENSRVDFCQFDVGSERICDVLSEEFDHIFSFYCLHWVPNQKRAFENIYKLLKPGGDVLLSFLATTPIFEVYENLSKTIQWAPYFSKDMVSPYHNCANPEEVVKKILVETGFQGCKCVVENQQYVFGSWDQLKKSVIAVNPTIPQLSPGERTKYLEDFTEEVRKIYRYNLKLAENNNEEKIPVNYQLVVVYACKPKIVC